MEECELVLLKEKIAEEMARLNSPQSSRLTTYKKWMAAVY